MAQAARTMNSSSILPRGAGALSVLALHNERPVELPACATGPGSAATDPTAQKAPTFRCPLEKLLAAHPPTVARPRPRAPAREPASPRPSAPSWRDAVATRVASECAGLVRLRPALRGPAAPVVRCPRRRRLLPAHSPAAGPRRSRLCCSVPIRTRTRAWAWAHNGQRWSARRHLRPRCSLPRPRPGLWAASRCASRARSCSHGRRERGRALQRGSWRARRPRQPQPVCALLRRHLPTLARPQLPRRPRRPARSAHAAPGGGGGKIRQLPGHTPPAPPAAAAAAACRAQHSRSMTASGSSPQRRRQRRSEFPTSTARRGSARAHAVCPKVEPSDRTASSSALRDETCPIGTEGGTRRVHLVREGRGGGSAGAGVRLQEGQRRWERWGARGGGEATGARAEWGAAGIRVLLYS